MISYQNYLFTLTAYHHLVVWSTVKELKIIQKYSDNRFRKTKFHYDFIASLLRRNSVARAHSLQVNCLTC
jgi:hypothetical protein